MDGMNTHEIASRIALKAAELQSRYPNINLHHQQCQRDLRCIIATELNSLVEELERAVFHLEQLQTAVQTRPTASEQARWCAEAQSWESVAAVRLKEADQLRAQLAEAQSVNKRVHDELLAEKEQVARMKSRHESNKAVVDGVWKQHEEQFEQLKTQLAEAQELLKAARAGQPLGPIIGAQTMLNQDSEIRHLKAQLASEQEKGRKAMQGLQKLTGYTFEIFHDGVGADLHDAGITTIEDAFMEGMQEATRELKDQAQSTLRELEGEPTVPAPKT